MENKKKGYLAELWAFGKERKNFVLLSPWDFKKNEWYVINGGYYVYQDKEKSTLSFYPPYGPRVLEVVDSAYIGDVRMGSHTDGRDDYNAAIQDYRDTGEIESKNKVGFKETTEPEKEEEEAPF